jgi:hypothetical protein
MAKYKTADTKGRQKGNKDFSFYSKLLDRNRRSRTDNFSRVS